MAAAAWDGSHAISALILGVCICTPTSKMFFSLQWHLGYRDLQNRDGGLWHTDKKIRLNPSSKLQSFRINDARMVARHVTSFEMYQISPFRQSHTTGASKIGCRGKAVAGVLLFCCIACRWLCFVLFHCLVLGDCDLTEYEPLCLATAC